MGSINPKIKIFIKVSTVLTIFILSYILATIIRNSDYLGSKYGINIIHLGWIFLVAEIIFNIGIFLMLRGSGFFKIGIKNIFYFNFSQVNFSGTEVYIGFIMNRLAAFLPWLYPLVTGWRTLPPSLIALIIIELAIVVFIGFLVKVPRKSLV
jgi:hypothetical protein